jgi:hypothetical protein
VAAAEGSRTDLHSDLAEDRRWIEQARSKGVNSPFQGGRLGDQALFRCHLLDRVVSQVVRLPRAMEAGLAAICGLL